MQCQPFYLNPLSPRGYRITYFAMCYEFIGITAKATINYPVMKLKTSQNELISESEFLYHNIASAYVIGGLAC